MKGGADGGDICGLALLTKYREVVYAQPLRLLKEETGHVKPEESNPHLTPTVITAP